MNKKKDLKKDKLKYEPPKAVFVALRLEERLGAGPCLKYNVPHTACGTKKDS